MTEALSLIAVLIVSVLYVMEHHRHRRTRDQLAKFHQSRGAKGRFVKRDKGDAL